MRPPKKEMGLLIIFIDPSAAFSLEPLILPTPIQKTPMKKTTLLLSTLALFPLARVPAEIIYEDNFNDDDLTLNEYNGLFVQGNTSLISEEGGAAKWNDLEGGEWDGVNIQTLDTWEFPAPGKKYTVEWTIGPMTVTNPSSYQWGDIRMQLILISANSGPGGPGSYEWWSLASGGLGVEINLNAGEQASINFGAKNDTNPAESNYVTLPGQQNQQLDPTKSHVIRIELSAAEASLYVDDLLVQTNALYLWDLGGGPGEEFENGFFLSTRGSRYTDTSSDPHSTGRGTMSVEKITVDLSDIPIPPETPAPALVLEPAVPGLQLTPTASQWDRQNIRTTNPEYSWVGGSHPVTYSFTIAKYPEMDRFAAYMYLVPAASLTTVQSAPDWSEAICLRAFISKETADGRVGAMALGYKNHARESNGLAGNEYWVNDTGAVYAGGEGPGADGTGKGGQIAWAPTSVLEGTWSITATSDTELTITTPDGSTATGVLSAETAGLFAGPLYVYFGAVPQEVVNQGSTLFISNLSITGTDTPLNENFTEPLDLAVWEESPANSNDNLQINTATSRFWLHWDMPDTGYVLEQSTTLNATPAWQNFSGGTLIRGDRKWKLLLNEEVISPNANFFRLRKP